VVPVGRPKLPPGKRKEDAVQLRLDGVQREVFDRLSANLAANELRGVDVTDAGVLRWLFTTAAEERGISAEGPKPKGKPKR
jgi:hypothetical protein